MTDSTAAPAPTTADLVNTGVSLFAKAEGGLKDAGEAMIHLRGIFAQAYANAAIKGADAIQAEATAIAIAGKISELRVALIDYHGKCTGYAKAAGVDVLTPFAELPAVTGIHPDGGGR